MNDCGNGIPEVFVTAAPGERAVGDNGLEMTATGHYRYNQYGLFRRFVWLNTDIGDEWFAVPCHWRDAKRKAAA